MSKPASGRVAHQLTISRRDLCELDECSYMRTKMHELRARYLSQSIFKLVQKLSIRLAICYAKNID